MSSKNVILPARGEINTKDLQNSINQIKEILDDAKTGNCKGIISSISAIIDILINDRIQCKELEEIANNIANVYTDLQRKTTWAGADIESFKTLIENALNNFVAKLAQLNESNHENQIWNSIKMKIPLNKIQNNYVKLKNLTNDFVLAQKHIILGFNKDISDTSSVAEQLMGSNFHQWALNGSSTDNKGWGDTFIKRIQYVKDSGGSITFVHPEIENYQQIQQISEYNAIDGKLLEMSCIIYDVIKKCNKTNTQTNEHIYNDFLSSFREFTEETVEGHRKPKNIDSKRYEQYWAIDHTNETTQVKGETTYFELAYMLSEGYEFYFQTDKTTYNALLDNLSQKLKDLFNNHVHLIQFNKKLDTEEI